MWVKYLESGDFKREAEKGAEAANNNEHFKPVERPIDPEIQEERVDVLKSIEAATGITFRVALEGMEANVAAFVDTGSRLAYVTERVLSDKRLALHAARHEKNHLDNSIFDIHLEEEMEEEALEALLREVGETELESVTLVEGFNELSTFRKFGRNEKSGYKDKEVPLAEKLERLAQRYLGESLLAAFDAGNLKLLLKRFELLGTVLALRGQLALAA